MAFLYAVIGDNRTGKSQLALLLAKMWKRSNKKGKIYAHDVNDDFAKIADFDIDANNKEWALELSEKKNVLLILDEIRLLHPSNQTHPNDRTLMAKRGKNNINIIYIQHNPRMILEIFAYYTHKYFIFFTNNRKGNFDEKVPDAELCLTAAYIVNKYAGRYDSHQYKALYPRFPYCIVDTKSGEISTQNMNASFLKKLNQKPKTN